MANNEEHTGVHLAPTATKVPADARGGVVVCGSHGGVYAGYLVARAGARALILNDAGVGLHDAGIGSLDYCEKIGLAAATVAHTSARIGDAADMLARGTISFANRSARAAGCEPGSSCRDATASLGAAPMPEQVPPEYDEARRVVGVNAHDLRIVCIDSVSLVVPEDEGQIVISGSHGGIVAGQAAAAIRVAAAAAFYNDAGIGADAAGISRLPVLDERGIAAVTVDAMTARIGDGGSTYEDGVVSRVNHCGAKLGIHPGMPAREAVELVKNDGVG